MPSMVHPSKRKTNRVYQSPAQDKLAAYGIEAICDDIGDGTTLQQIADKLGIGIGRLAEWLDLEPERAALARAARSRTAPMWDEFALTTIQAADTAIAIAKAREVANHLRWRTTKIRPQDYGDKVQINHTGRVEHALVSDDEVDRRLAAFAGVTIDEDGQLVED